MQGCISGTEVKKKKVELGGGEGALLVTCDPLPLGDSVLGRSEFPSLGVMHRGSP